LRRKPQSDGGSLIPTEASSKKITYSDIFYDALPYYLSIGMHPSEYWEGNIYMAEAYRKAHRLQLIEQNQDNYLKGLYTFHAVGIALSNVHLDGKKHKTNNYLANPFDLYSTEEEKRAKAEKKAQEETQRIIAYLDSLKGSWDRREQKNGNQNRQP